jgi:purine nucleosidase
LFGGRDVSVAIETESPLVSGMTVVDWSGVTGRAANVKFMSEVDADAVYELLAARLARLP